MAELPFWDLISFILVSGLCGFLMSGFLGWFFVFEWLIPFIYEQRELAVTQAVTRVKEAEEPKEPL
jgi:hypothetical protein